MYLSVASNIINVIGNVIGVFVLKAGVAGVAQSIWSMAADWVFRAVIFYARQRSGKWKNFRVI